MNTVTENIPQPLVFSDAAAAKVKRLIDEEGNPKLKLRVFVQGGGCSGFQYGFTFDEEAGDDDTRGVVREHAQVALAPRHLDVLDRALEYRALGGEHRQRERSRHR